MSTPHLDANVLIRFLTGDHLDHQARAHALLERVQRGELTLRVTESVVAEVVFVLSSPRLYHLPRSQIQALLSPLLALRHLRVQNRRTILSALALYTRTPALNFGDCLLVAHAQRAGAREIYSFDRGFDRIAHITRLEP